MMTLNNIKKARDNWKTAAIKFNFKLVTPFEITLHGKQKEVFAYLPELGSTKGIIVELTGAPEFNTDNDVVEWANHNNSKYSFINIENFLEFNEEKFLDALEDWGYVK